MASYYASAVWVIEQLRDGEWRKWSERDFTGRGGDSSRPMDPRHRGDCYMRMHGVVGDQTIFRYRNTATCETEPLEGIGPTAG